MSATGSNLVQADQADQVDQVDQVDQTDKSPGGATSSRTTSVLAGQGEGGRAKARAKAKARARAKAKARARAKAKRGARRLQLRCKGILPRAVSPATAGTYREGMMTSRGAYS